MSVQVGKTGKGVTSCFKKSGKEVLAGIGFSGLMRVPGQAWAGSLSAPREPPAAPLLCPIPEREERRPPRQCNWQKGEVYYWLEPGPSATSNAVVQVREPRAQAVTQIYRVSTCCWFKRIGYKFAKQFHWSKLSCRQDFPGGFHPIPNFLIGKQWSVLSKS